MKIVSSYKVQIVGINKMLKPTLDIYRNALSLLIPIVFKEWDDIYKLDLPKARFNFAEHLVHSTSANTAKYPEFDRQFYKMPSYFRRAVIAEAIGIVSSHVSRMENWEKSGMQGNEPKLQINHFACPTFYRGNSYLTTDNPDVVQLKLYVRNDWIWVPVKLRHTDMQYITNHCSGKMSAPTLERKRNKYYLRFAFKDNVSIDKTPIANQRILAVDLGVNHDAVCSVMDANGTVLNRKFINFHSEKDQLYHTLNKIKKKQKLHHATNRLWSYVVNCNEQHAIHVAHAIIEHAVQQKVHCIVFEHLDMKGKIHGKRKQKLAMWRKQYIQNIVAHKAHRNGIRISHVNAWNTSKLAFDGTGKVTRDDDNYSMCKFAGGKLYHCDLNASYNIGARYFIREILKTLPVRVRSQVETKVSLLAKRTQCTLSTLISMNAALSGAIPSVA